MRRARAAHARRAWQAATTLPGFDPRDVPEIAAGYWWDAANSTGIGTTGFRVLEGNGRTTHDLLQATVASQPTVLTENGGTQFRMRDTGDSNPSTLASAAVASGWTGATYVGMWVRLPDASGDITGAGGLFGQFASTGNQRRMSWTLNTTTQDNQSTINSVDGIATAGLTTRWVSALTGGAWTWLEWVFDPLFVLGGSTIAEKLKQFANLSASTRFVDNTGDQTALFDATTPIIVASRVGVAGVPAANLDTTDWATCYLGNGIPSLFHRQRLMARRAPIATSFF